MVLAKPKELSWVEAAALPENWMTGQFQDAWQSGMTADASQHTKLW
jgi:hypothetical protein